MLGQEQLNQLAQSFSIDTFSVFREYLQLLFLSSLYREKESRRVFFKGGTALRLIFGSPRFSEDLDFSVTLKKNGLKKLVARVFSKMKLEVSDLKLESLYQGKSSWRFRLVYRGGEFKYPLSLRLDFAFDEPLLAARTVTLSPDYPLQFFPLVAVLAIEEIFAEKLRAFSLRGRGRDVFDLWFLWGKNVTFNRALVKKKFSSVGKIFSAEKLRRRLLKISTRTLALDLHPFLPAGYRSLTKGLIKDVGERLAGLEKESSPRA